MSTAVAIVAATVDPPEVRTEPVRATLVTLLALGWWAGLAYGFGEGLEVMLLSLIPGALAWRNGNAPDILWFAPLFYGAVFPVLALLVAGLARVFRRLPAATLLVFLCVGSGAFLGLTMPSGVLSDFAALALALGFAAEAARQYHRHQAVLGRFLRRSLPYLALAPLLVAGVIVGGGRLLERARLAQLPAAAPGRPNILLLIIDTQRADHLSSYGYARPTSPRLDAFAREGERFANAFAPSPWTLPSHATFLTGRPLHEHGAGLIRRPYLDGRYTTLPEALARAGYATGGFVGNFFWVGRQTGLARGFLHFEDYYSSLADAVARTSLGRRVAYKVLPRLGFTDLLGRKRAPGIDRSLLQWVDGVHDRPFFAFVNYLDVHAPYLPPAPYDGLFGDAVGNSHTLDIGAIYSDVEVPPPAALRDMVDRYDESIRYLDTELGRLFDQLRERRLLDNTVVIVSSDHGESFGEHGMLHHGTSLSVEQIHVPLIIRYPRRVPAQSVEPRPVNTEDLAATIADFAQLPAGTFPGRSLLARPAAGELPPVVAEVGRRAIAALNWPSSQSWQSSLVSGRWHLIRSGTGRRQLFDLSTDPGELHDRSADPAVAGDLARLTDALERIAPPSRLRWKDWSH